MNRFSESMSRSRASCVAFFALYAVACGSPREGTDGEVVPREDAGCTSCPPPMCTDAAWAAPMPWTLPFPLLTTERDASSPGSNDHALLDLDGDGDLDFVVHRDTEREAPDPLVGRQYWLVFANTGSGWSPTPTQWTLPFPLITTERDASAPGSNDHTLLDLDGDGDLDFVVHRDTERASPDPLVGRQHWLVFANTGSGWSPTPTSWMLAFPLVTSERDASSPRSNDHALLDLDGDGDLDFVVHRDAERASPDPLVGRQYWLVFSNTGSGWSPTPTQWTLPFPLVTPEVNASSPGSNDHALLDLDGDGDLDFVVHRDAERASPDPLVGRQYWLVFTNTGSGWSPTPTPWTLPFPLVTTERNASSPGSSDHALLDLDSDGSLDFVVHRDGERSEMDPLVGRQYWLVFANTGSGWSATSAPWTLPYPLIGALGNASSPATEAHALLDLDGDGDDDFVLHREREREADPDPLIGRNHWIVYRNGCR